MNAGPDLAGMRILVIDDQPLLVALQLRQLRALGISQVQAAGSGAVESLPAGEAPDLFMVELQLVHGNGFQLGRRLMAAHAVPAILMTATARPTDELWAQRLGFAATLRRPANDAVCRDLLCRVLEGRHAD